MQDKEPKQVTLYLDQAMIDEIQKMADERLWSFSQATYVLLQQAVKSVNAKKKNATEKDHS